MAAAGPEGTKISLPPLPTQRHPGTAGPVPAVPSGGDPAHSRCQHPPRQPPPPSPGGSSPATGHSQWHPREKEQHVPSQPSPQPRHANPNICKRRSPPWERRLDTEFTCPSNA